VSCCSTSPPRGQAALAAQPQALPGGAERPTRLINVRGGRFTTGTDRPVFPQDGEGFRRKIVLKPFLIDPFAVTNAWFAEFVAATGYHTEAERHGWSLVFRPCGASPFADGPTWWERVEGACWRTPHGDGSSALPDHPVVQVSWTDADAFATWAGGRLPSEAEWECAASGGLNNARYPWGDREPDDDDFLPCNIWQGAFPERNTEADGFYFTAPVDAFAPNGFGLRNMVGNTWEWCADPFQIRSLARGARERNEAARRQNMRLLKGGSHLCHRSYCHRYRIAARTGVTPDSGTTHVGFRLVFDLA
jgi:formylglycine-generating enzyme